MKRTPRSKLHRSIKKKLGLGRLGFKSEKWIGRYRCDEVCFDRRVIVEVHGDAVHGNPRVFRETDELPYGVTAGQKWDQDAERTTFLEEHGWLVIVVWESDDLRQKRELVEMALRVRPAVQAPWEAK